jgi:hypothetical protein
LEEISLTSWYSKNFGDGIAAFGPANRVTAAFAALAGDHNVASDAAIFCRYDPTGVATLYFSPTAHVMAAAFGASPCAKPEPDPDLALLVGDFASWALHFPGHRPAKFD